MVFSFCVQFLYNGLMMTQIWGGNLVAKKQMIAKGVWCMIVVIDRYYTVFGLIDMI